jgi:hypothetical protein
LFSGLFAAALGTGCSFGHFVLRHTLNVTASPDVELVDLPPALFQLDHSPPQPGKWVLVNSITARKFSSLSTRAASDTKGPNVFDLSPMLAMDPFGGVWAAPLPTRQAVFVRAASAARIKRDLGEWDERYVVQLAINRGPEQLGTTAAERLASQDPARILCHDHVTRHLISQSPSDAIYESRFADCPDFGPDRVVLTREFFGDWSAIRGSQAIFAFSYESIGERFTPAQRKEGMRLIEAPALLISAPEGEKHPLARDEELRFATNS